MRTMNTLMAKRTKGQLATDEISGRLVEVGGLQREFALARELTQRKQREQELHRANERMKSGLEAAESLLRKEKRSVIWHALESLDPNLRAVLVLKDMEELSYAEISRKLDIPEGTVGSRLNQARKELAENLKGHSAMN